MLPQMGSANAVSTEIEIVNFKKRKKKKKTSSNFISLVSWQTLNGGDSASYYIQNMMHDVLILLAPTTLFGDLLSIGLMPRYR